MKTKAYAQLASHFHSIWNPQDGAIPIEAEYSCINHPNLEPPSQTCPEIHLPGDSRSYLVDNP